MPYSWTRATRYEIPCRVSGTVRVGDEEIEFAGPGQRDHSWGHRDWWASDWMWSALHFEDGTHTHAVGVPQVPGFGVGYVQHGREVTEINTVNATERSPTTGSSPKRGSSRAPQELDIAIEPLAFGPVLLVAPDGRTTEFPRAMCRATHERRARGHGLGGVEPQSAVSARRAGGQDGEGREAGVAVAVPKIGALMSP